MAPVDRKPCRDCGKGLFRGQRRLASTLQPWLVMLEGCNRDRSPYTFSDVFCNACRKKIQKGAKGFGPLLESIPITPHDFAVRSGLENEIQDDSVANDEESLQIESGSPETRRKSLEMECDDMAGSEDRNSVEIFSESMELMDCVEAAYSSSETNSEPLAGFSGSAKKHVKNLRGKTAKQVKNAIRSAKLTLNSTLTVPYTESYCCVCSKTENSRRIVPTKVRLNFWNETRIWIPSRYRCCESHITSGRFDPESFKVLQEKAKLGARLSGNDVEEWFQRLTQQKPSQLIDVDSEELSDMDYDDFHDSEFVRKLYDAPEGSVIVILDGTYLYVQKSGDHKLQKSTFCLPKGRNLVKIMMVVTATGYIVEASECYLSDSQHNDAKILLHMFKQAQGIYCFVRDKDIFVVDRGFRDALPSLHQEGIDTLMPALMNKSKKQFDDTDANHTRKVTLTRWVVEAVNGRLKNKFKFFDMVIPCHYFNRSCDTKLTRFLKIACAIINAFSPPIFKDREEHAEILEDIRRRETLNNSLKEELNEDPTSFIRGTKKWTKLTSREIQFPDLSLAELRKLTLGRFQIHNAPGYADEHLRLDRNFIIESYKVRDGLLRTRLKSRFRSVERHYIWIEYSMDGLPEKIIRYYCQCQMGARTIGCCSHIACVLWFLGYKRNVAPEYEPRTFGTGILDVTAKQAEDPEFEVSDTEPTVDDSEEEGDI